MKVVPFRKGVRYLGVNWSPGFDRDDASASVRRVVDRFLGCLSSVPVTTATTSLTGPRPAVRPAPRRAAADLLSSSSPSFPLAPGH